ncbi:MAG: NAD(P)-binding domain-containing protein, partial [bacterium]|nr:NAD(P)-binding domain-containing protein [bacterium]
MAEKVGVVGLGEMGFPMAWNLRKSGFDVFAFDVREETVGKAREKGIQTCGSVREVAARSDHAVLTLVRDIPQTEAVIFGENGIVSSGKRGLSIVMMSTLDPRTVRELGERSAKAGFPLLDAPSSGAK